MLSSALLDAVSQDCGVDYFVSRLFLNGAKNSASDRFIAAAIFAIAVIPTSRSPRSTLPT